MIKTHQDQVIDPACGSGTFLVYALKRKMEKSRLIKKKQRLVAISELLDQIWGIDINPLSVILSRTNLYLTSTHLMGRRRQLTEVRPRVYAADSFLLYKFQKIIKSEVKDINETKEIITNMPITDKISIPILPTLEPKSAMRYIEDIGEMLEKGYQRIENIQGTGIKNEYRRALFNSMLNLRTEYGDNLWMYVLMNYGIPPLLYKHFDVVIGNPPWLAYRESRDSIQKLMDNLANEYNIEPKPHVKTSFNLAIPFFLASSKFAKQKGIIGFILPHSVFGPPHEKYIKLLEENKIFSLKKAYDFKDVKPSPFPHNLPSAALVVEVCK